MDEAEFSVVIPAKNRSAMLGRAISSALQQTLPPKEIIVVDDGSDEPDFFLLSEKFPQVKWLRQKNKGVSAARNRGIEMASCQWIALLDSDDLWHEEKLLSQSRFIGKNPDIPAVHTDERWIRSGNEVMPPKYLDKSPNGLWERSLENCLICASSIAIHQSVFEKIGLFDEELEVCEDYDFWLRMLLEVQVGLVPEKLVTKHGGHPDQLSTSTWGMDRFRVKSLKKLLRHKGLTNQMSEKVRQVLSLKCSILEQGARKRKKFSQADYFAQLANS